eukprot:TRINITY_DN36219_c0_g1_i1.p1 TRINITY_DN36219_c0_g1~~TRINITY_DN36219_c0_g1_i1.p1  ORF type:complete len:318 (+),score=49.55 TRINITY_DN36219_c0_g1_i1:176-1129(+)
MDGMLYRYLIAASQSVPSSGLQAPSPAPPTNQPEPNPHPQPLAPAGPESPVVETELLYLAYEGMFALEAEAVVTGAGTDPALGEWLTLNRTPLYPTGGGQPCDTGYIGQIKVSAVKKSKSGQVLHWLASEPTTLSTLPSTTAPALGHTVTVKVDPERRDRACKLHSAGHILDKAMHDCGYPFPAGKASHFPGPNNAYVEYLGKVPEPSRDQLAKELEVECNRYIQEGHRVTVQELPYAELAQACGGSMYVPEFVSKQHSTRVVSVCPGLGCVCGGTHVRDISIIGNMRVVGLRVKKGVTRIYYEVPGTDFELQDFQR